MIPLLAGLKKSLSVCRLAAAKIDVAVSSVAARSLISLTALIFDRRASFDTTPLHLLQEMEEHRIFFKSSKNLIFVLDINMQILRVTPSIEHILGISPDSILRSNIENCICDEDLAYISSKLSSARADSLQRDFDARLVDSDGRKIAFSWSCSWSETAKRFFCILRDQTKIIEQQQTILAQNVTLDLALENITQGLVMFDSAGLVSLYNRKLGKIFSGTEIALADSAADIIDSLITNRHIGNGTSLAKHLKDISERNLKSDISEAQYLADGREISFRMTNLKDGGVLCTFEDVSQLRRALSALAINNDELAHRESELRNKHMQLDAAVNNMKHGLVLVDAAGCLTLANDQVLKLYGVDRDDLTVNMTITDLLELRVSKGVAKRDLSNKAFAAFVKRTRGHDGKPFVVKMTNGRLVSIDCIPMSSGGWVITFLDVTDQREKEAKIAYMARHDSLTNLPNRVVLAEALEKTIAHCQRGKSAALHFLDLDFFKNVNDTLGHAIGDKLLVAVAERLRKCVRPSDTVARLGGDEFAILQTFIERPEDATTLATRAIEVIRAPYEIDGQIIVIGASVGIALSPANGTTSEALLKNSDLALYRAKDLGRGAYHFFELALNQKMQARRTIEADLRVALIEQQFELHYQPLVSIETRKIYGVEALLRWRHPIRGLISPLEFIPIAEETGLITSIGEWVIHEACRAAAAWPSDIRVAVNLSPVQLRRSDIVRTITDALAASNVDPERLEIEITESSLLEASDTVLEILQRLRDLGIGVALDDFGTGYSSLSYLQSFPFTNLKIDRSFIKELGSKKGASEIVKAIVAIAKAVNMKVTAEGIETEDQLQQAIVCGCTEFQGYLFSRPQVFNVIAQLISKDIDSLRFAT